MNIRAAISIDDAVRALDRAHEHLEQALNDELATPAREMDPKAVILLTSATVRVYGLSLQLRACTAGVGALPPLSLGESA